MQPAIALHWNSIRLDMKYVLLVLIILSALFISCSNHPTGKELMVNIAQTDSIELIYYRAAGDENKYTHLPLNDEEFIQEIVDDLNEQAREKADCLKEGAIRCYDGGKELNKIFFSYNTKDCIQFCYNKDGVEYRFKMSEDVKEKLLKFKSFARDPEQDSSDKKAVAK